MNLSRRLLALSLVSALFLSGCGSTSGNSSAASASAPVSALTQSQEQLLALTLDGQSLTLAPAQRYCTWNAPEAGTECFDMNTEAVTQSWDNLTLTTGAGIQLGDTIDQVMDAYHIRPNFAELDYEYDTAGDGATEVNTRVYDGALPDWEQENILDLCISTAYCRKGDQWVQMDLSQQHYSDYDGPKVVYDFDFTEATEGDVDSVMLSMMTITYYTP